MSSLRANRLGVIIGSGSQLNMELEIEFAETGPSIDNLDEAVIDLVTRVLEQAGAPAGSEVRFSRDGNPNLNPRSLRLPRHLDSGRGELIFSRRKPIQRRVDGIRNSSD